MSLKIYKEKEESKDTYLRLIEDDEVIRLIACDEKGEIKNSGVILNINKDGLYLHEDMGDFGIAKDESDRIKIRE